MVDIAHAFQVMLDQAVYRGRLPRVVGGFVPDVDIGNLAGAALRDTPIGRALADLIEATLEEGHGGTNRVADCGLCDALMTYRRATEDPER